MPTQDSGDCTGVCARFGTVVRDAQAHQERAEIRVSEPERPILVRTQRDFLRRIRRERDDDFHRRGKNAHGCTEARNVKQSIVIKKLDKVDASEVASGIVQKEVFTARIAGVDAPRLLARVPFLNGIVKLHARVGASPRGVRNLVHEMPRVIFGGDFTARAIRRLPRLALQIGVHENVRDADRVVAVLPADGAVSLSVEICRVSSGDEGLRLLFLLEFPVDVVNNFRVLYVKNHHFRGAARCPPRLDAPSPPVEPFQEGEHPGTLAAAGEMFAFGAHLAKI